MTSLQQRAELHRQIWAIANDVRGSVDGWDFKQYVLGALFYRFISENFSSYIEAGDDSICYAKLDDSVITDDIKDDAIKTKGYFIYPSQGKSGGEFFTPQHVSKLIAQLAMHGQTHVNKIYDPAAGSGSLLLQAKKQFDNHIIEEGFFGQEINHTTYNLARMNMFLHNINYDKFDIRLGNTLTEPHFGDEKPFDAIVSNPPYSVKWIGSDDPTLINDERFAPAGVLAPKSKADFAFVLHALNYLSAKGRAAIVCFPGIFYRGGAEQKIRQYLVDNNYVETVISLAPNLFFGTTIAVNILVLSKHKTDTKVQFIDASELFKKETTNNILTDAHIEQIMQVFASKEDVAHLAKSVAFETVVANDYNLSVSCYVEAKDNREIINIAELNAELKTTVSKIDQLRKDIDAIVAEIEGCEVQK
ncbi:type I restriction-modification system subunit M [Enterobacter sp.]|uniref:type I restriction-modification system subunit M n=1 Tax=Enterobacter sp. TaxID=42895 RepID=UPI00290E5A1F|nr:type I restriction-modification system subunit M [Enterobacter sp.]MDU7343815.1 type I restriction-modification system subunit M [Enterobacter sp.]